MNRRHFLTTLASVPVTAVALPFDPEVISRLSVDNKPRSLSIRQGADVWLGYDLERATVFKVWQAPAGKPGLIKGGFVMRSAGKSWYEDATNEGWTLRRGDKILPLAVRYLGCTHKEDHLSLRWELKHGDEVLKLHERVPLAAAPAAERVVRELRVESLGAGEALVLPVSMHKAWKMKADQEQVLTSAETYRLTLP